MYRIAMTFAKRYLIWYLFLLACAVLFLAMWREIMRGIGWDDMAALRFVFNGESHLINSWALGFGGLAATSFAIPILLYFYVRLRPDDPKLNRITLAFAGCFFLSGVTCSLLVYILVIPAYRLLMIVGGLTALAWSLLTVGFGYWVKTEARASKGTRQLRDESDVKDLIIQSMRRELDDLREQRVIDKKASTAIVQRMEGVLSDLHKLAASNETARH